MKLEIIRSNNSKFDSVRRFIEVGYSKRYSGWNSKFDGQFDNQSVCFVIESNDEIVATSRLVFKGYSRREKLSFEYSHNTNFQSQNYDIECEGTGLCFRMGYLQPLMLGMFTWLDHQDIGNSACLFDPQNIQIKNYQQYILEYAPIQQAVITFEKFHRIDHTIGKPESEPVGWGIGVQTKMARKRALRNLQGILISDEHLAVLPP